MYVVICCPQLLSITTSVQVLFSLLCTSATILRFSSVMMHAISKMWSLVTSRPARDGCIGWTKHYISNNISMLKFQRIKQGQIVKYWCTHLSSMGPTDHTVSRCTYGQGEIHNIHEWHSQIQCIITKIRSLWITIVRKSVQLGYHLMLNHILKLKWQSTASSSQLSWVQFLATIGLKHSLSGCVDYASIKTSIISMLKHRP